MTTKELVLEALEKGKGEFISGEALAKRCQVSRTAIWKSIAELKQGGYAIRSVTNRGYLLEEASDIISKSGICMHLEAAGQGGTKGSVCPDRIFVHEELDSTNNEAKRRVLFCGERLLHGTLIVAKRQTAGRGHFGSSFASPEGGVYLSFIVDAAQVKDTSAPVAQLASAAVSRVLERLFACAITKEKDSSLYLGRDKVCGILTEGICDLETGIFSTYIVGIGIWMERLLALQGPHPQKNELIAALIGELDI